LLSLLSRVSAALTAESPTMVFLAAVVPPALLLLFSAWKLKLFTHHPNHLHRMSSTPSTKQRWFPLESNPDLINKYIKGLGFDTSLYEFVDVFSTEDWALQMIPQPVVAVIMLYPLSEKQESCYDQDVLAMSDTDKVWFIKQRIGNACGTIGLLHSLLNTPEPLRAFAPDSWLHSFQDGCPNPLDPIAKAEMLEGDKKIATLHDQATSSEDNQTDRGNIEDKLTTHFVALVNVNNKLYELDGRKQGPVLHGDTTEMTMLQDACKVVKVFMDRDPGEMRFTILALAPKVE
jgi:ubiquitin carboxyl-terminal hydrolase L3